MKKAFLIYALLLYTMSSFAQTFPFNMDEIKKEANANNYNKLLKRYQKNDTTLTLSDYIILYYGQPFQSHYKPNVHHDSVDALNDYMNKNMETLDFKRVIGYTENILKDFPFNIDHIYVTGVAYEKTGDQKQAAQWFYKYDKLIRTILYSGDGRSEESAYVVMKIEDEYTIVNALELQSKGQALKSKDKKFYDVISVAENNYGIEKVYFNIDLFFNIKK